MNNILQKNSDAYQFEIWVYFWISFSATIYPKYYVPRLGNPVDPLKRTRPSSSSLIPFPRVGRSVGSQDLGIVGEHGARLYFGQKRTGKSSLIPFPRVGRRSQGTWDVEPSLLGGDEGMNDTEEYLIFEPLSIFYIFYILQYPNGLQFFQQAVVILPSYSYSNFARFNLYLSPFLSYSIFNALTKVSLKRICFFKCLVFLLC